ncbi:transporter [Noviherbaspirillum sp. CPCC 100848]|uniref:Transporter n=1 Tax=Noviherbaspirillum album TaxID=3080276 RepID=A0ABU6J495_9BURK|nr:transporter [Noviherbaspirillum sp. CPCC 100848]MEC4718448.1 transporter [Noviherbaspirillum sp. CPCC 100848]
MLFVKSIVYVLLMAMSTAAWSQTFGDVTPYRPSVSNPAQLSRPGQLELELGGLHKKVSSDREGSLPYLFKLGFTKEWGVLLGGDAHIRTRDEVGNRENGVGDTTVTLKRAFLIRDETAFGLEVGAKLPTAKDAIGVGKVEYTLNGIYSQDFGPIHMDTNINATRIGQVDPGVARTQKGLSVALSTELSSDWSSTAEVSGMRRRGTPTESQFLAAVVYSPNKRYAIDIGLTKGVNRASNNWSVFSGFVVPIANLW